MKTTEKANEQLQKFGKTLKDQRDVVSKKTPQELAHILTIFSGIAYTQSIIEEMESGSPQIPIVYWIHLWQYYQNIDKIIKAYDAKEMMYLSQQEFLPHIEEEIMKHHHKEKLNENKR